MSKRQRSQEKQNSSGPLSLEQAEQMMAGTGLPQVEESTGGEFQIQSLPGSLKAAIANLAAEHVQGKVSATEAQLSLKNWSKQGYPIDPLRSDFEREVKRLEVARVIETQTEEKPTLTADESAEARKLGSGDLIVEYQNALRTLGYVANRFTTLGIMHTAYSRLANVKSGWFHHGRSRSGKSEGLDCAYRFTHSYNRMRATSITEGAIYSLGILDHKFILGGELRVLRPGDDDRMQQLLRQFLSERELTHMRLEESAGKGGKRYERTSHTVGGFASIAWTSTKDPHQFNDEFALRLTAVPSNEDADTTRQVQALKAERAKDPKRIKAAENEVIERFNLFDLSLQPYDVVIPFADQIMLANFDTSARGIFELLLSHVRISALYSQYKRKVDTNGCLIATVDDYAAAVQLVSNGAFRVFDPVSSSARDAFDLLAEKFGQPQEFGGLSREFRLMDVTEAVCKPRSTCQGYLAQLVVAEMISVVNASDPKRYRIIGSKETAASDLGLVPVEDIVS